jgi:predicted amidohydrolase/ribosomal protein S18 acetylase RimI-like enzyme
MTVDLTDFETKIRLRRLQPEDFEPWEALLKRCFPTLVPWKEEQFLAMLQRFPAGQLCIEIDGRIAAASSALIVHYDDYSDWHDYMEICDQGYLRNHDPGGDTLYGIEMMVDPDFRGRKLARRLYDARKQLCREYDCARMIIGGRIPGYAAHKEEMTAAAYVQAVMEKRLYDPVLTTQLANGFQLRQLIADYLPNDEDSAGWATCMEWPNLDHVSERKRRGRRAVAEVRLALVQYGIRPIQSWDDFEKQCEFFVDTASDQKVDFLCFPELFTVQLFTLVPAGRPADEARRLAEFTPRYLELFGRLATRYNINLIGGSTLTADAEGRLHNTAFLFRRDGSIEEQRKLHPTPEEARWWGVQGGDRLEVFDTDAGRIAILICYDSEFPELARVVTEKGAQLLFVPSNTSDRRGHLRVRLCCQARAIENQVFVINAGCVGNLPLVANADTHYAQSGIFTPSDIPFARDGVAVEAEPNVETVLFQDVDLEQLRRARSTGTVRNWKDRRTDLYRVVFRDGGGETLEV